MHLSITSGHRARAASSAGVSDRTFRRWMRQARVRVPRSDAKLNARTVQQVRQQQGHCTRAQLSTACGVSRSAIDKALSYETWRRDYSQ